MRAGRSVIALEHRLRGCRNVRILGIRPNLADYTERELAQIQAADRIYYPGSLFAELFSAMGKPIFPSAANYACAQDKIKQTALFGLAGIPHPRTRVFYGRRQKQHIAACFAFPFIAKVPRGSARGRGVFLIRDRQELDAYAALPGPAYIQELLPITRDIRVVVIGSRAVHAYWRSAAADEFRCNVARGGRVELDLVPPAAVALALTTARRCGWNDVGIDICCHRERFMVLEANMKYGTEGFRCAGIDYRALMERLIADDEI
jgi:ribosomal protein S6--L-glutamate ligase